jgi:hypothetical protein
MRHSLGLSLLACAAAAQVTVKWATGQPPATGTGVIAGTVVDASTHEPVRKAEVTLGGAMAATPVAVTDASGRFVFRALPAGSYWLRAQKSGYNPPQNALGIQETHEPINLAADAEKEGVEIGLMRDASLSGSIVDEEGMPIRGCTVNAVEPYLQQGRRDLRSVAAGTPTDDQGEYRMYGLPAGHYQLLAQCRSELAAAHPLLRRGDPRTPYETYLPQFLGGGLDLASATTLSIAAGASLDEINFQMRRTPGITLRGSLSPENGLAADSQGLVQLLPANTLIRNFYQFNGGIDTASGTFEIRSVVPGTYLLVATVNPQGHSMYALETVEVGTKTPQPIEITLSSGAQLKGAVEFDSDDHPPLDKGQVWLTPADPLPVFGTSQAEIAPDGTFMLPAVWPGRWRVATSLPGYVKLVTLGNQPVSPFGFEVLPGASGALRVVVGSKLAEVHVTIAGPSPQQSSVLIYPEDLDQLGAGLERGMWGSPAGTMLPPGRYRLLAVDQPNAANLLQRPDLLRALESHTQTIEVPEGGHVRVTVEAVSREELLRLLDEKE